MIQELGDTLVSAWALSSFVDVVYLLSNQFRRRFPRFCRTLPSRRSQGWLLANQALPSQPMRWLVFATFAKPQRRRVVITALVHGGDCAAPPGPGCAAFSKLGQAILNPVDVFDPRVGQAIALNKALEAMSVNRTVRKTFGKLFRAAVAPPFHVVVQLRQGRRILKSYALTLSNQHGLDASGRFGDAVAAVSAPAITWSSAMPAAPPNG